MQSQRLIDSTTRHAVLVEGLKTGEVAKFAPFLIQMDRSISARLLGGELTEYSRTRLARLLTATRSDLQQILGEYQGNLELSLINIAEYEAEFEAANLDNLGFDAVVPAASQVRAAVFSAPLSVTGADGGKLLEPFIKDWAKSDADFLTNAIRRGAYEGQTNAQISRIIRGTVAQNFNNGNLAVVARHAEAITRTSVQHVASVAKMETWQDNDDIVMGYKWLSTLDGRTSTICRSLDGRVYRFGKGPLPPAHINCRSTTLAALSDDLNDLDEGGTRAARSTETGKTVSVKANETYYTWLKSQPKAFQTGVLGPARAKLLRDGGLSAERFSQLQLDRRFKPLTLQEMRKMEPLAFERAGV